MFKLFLLTLLLISSIHADENYKELNKKYSYLSAITACKELGSPWRLPQIWELFSLKGQTQKFGLDKRYWSKTSLKEKRKLDTHMASDEFFIRNTNTPAFAFYLQDGDVTPTPKETAAFVLCTNLDKNIQNEIAFNKNDDGVIDTINDILWEPLTKQNREIKVSHEDAQEICEDKTLDDKLWRLPTLDELYSIVNYDYVKPSLNPKIFSNMQKKYYWSDDEFSEDEAYVVGFSIGSVATSKKNNESFFRCVSDLDE